MNPNQLNIRNVRKLIQSVAAAMMLLVAQAAVAQARYISADFDDVKGAKSETYFKCIGAGRANEGLRADWQRQMVDVQANFPYEYIRFHGLFHDDMGVLTKNEKGEMVYNFQYIDELYDFLLSVGIKPFVELSFMPEPLKSGEETIFWWKGNITPANSQEEWGKLIDKFVRHLTARYGEKEVESWYFEVWNEPNLNFFFTGTQEQYFEMYATTARAIKAIDEDYRVGGPATAGNAWITPLVDYAKANNVACDFITTHTYGVHGAGLDEFGVQQLRMNLNAFAVYDDVMKSRNEMNGIGKQDMELHYTEWNTSYSPKDLTHDTYFNAAYVLNTLRYTDEAAQSMSYWTFTDIFEEAGVPTSPFHGGFGLINLQGLRKPTYFAYKYLYELGETELTNSDKQSWVCKDDDGSIQVLAYNVTMPTYGEKDFNNTIFAVERIPAHLEPINVSLSNIPDGTYRLEVYYTGYKQNDIQTAWIELGSPNILLPAQEETLRLASLNTPQTLEVITIKDGSFSQSFPMRENDVCFIKLTPQ